MTEAPERTCGACTLCCTLLRVDELAKRGGTPCRELRAPPAAPGCGIHAARPAICRGYRCMWLAGALDDSDRPDRLGAVLDVATEGGVTRLRVHQARPGVYEASPRLREIVAGYREAMPVRLSDVSRADDADAPVRELGPGDTELRLERDRWVRLQGGRAVDQGRLPWLERTTRRLVVALRRRRLRRYS